MAPALLDHQLTVPDEATANQAAEAVDVLERFLRQHPNLPGIAVSLNADDSHTTLQIPGHALRLLVNILAQIANGNADLSQRTEQQASSLEETAATTEELAASVKASAQASRNAAAISDEAMKAAQAGGAIAGQPE